MEQAGTALAERIAERRRGDGDPRALVGEMRRSVLLVPVADGGLWSVRSGGAAVDADAAKEGRGRGW
ncbi:hypothetical protein [Streptomyces sp. NTH33]|uniref:hypothetical protein n=1 Tax=Streptomyces sp. NTH33 TaxID=1735453 RepID=UPI0011B9420E|nr:hypothetical protein [Streptomyces sp. NTH33]